VPLCVTIDRWSPIVTLPVRSSPPLAATVKLTVPFPCPLGDAVSEIQPTSAVAVHAQSLDVAIVTLAEPPPSPTR
jgi:hypothetical protein